MIVVVSFVLCPCFHMYGVCRPKTHAVRIGELDGCVVSIQILAVLLRLGGGLRV